MASNSKNIAELLNGDTTVTATDLSYPLTGFSSTGIDDNADATAITIDSSENVLIGKTSADFGTAVGFEANSNDTVYATRSGGASLTLNRKSSDGDIALFRKDGTTVGSVATYGNDLIVGTGDTRLRFIDSLDSIFPVSNSTGTSRDAGIDLGHSETRFKDIYTSGGIYLGAASNSTPVTANKLDDYEEGEYTPTITGATSGSATLRSGYNYLAYTKVGRLVTVTGRWETTGGNNMVGNVVFSLPFAQSGNLSAQAECGVGTISMNRTGTDFDSTNLFQTVTFPSESQFYIYYQSSGTGNESLMQGSQLDAAFEGYVNHTYLTD